MSEEQVAASQPTETAPEAAPPATPEAPAAPRDELASELRAEIAAQRAELEEMQRAQAPVDPEPAAPAEPPEIAKLREESQRLRAELDELRGNVAKTEESARKQARSDAFARLGVLEEYHDVIPSHIDPRTGDGARELETWLAQRPLLTRSRAPVPPEIDVEGFAPSVQQVLRGEKANPLISKESIRAMQSHAREHRR
jgi:hypothetical protein